jgi:glycosyltransferase involved in cell wall biosynthesis
MENKNKYPSIAIVVVVYNAEKYLQQCLDSLILQTLKPTKIIICNDASKDRSIDIIRQYQGIYPDLIEIIDHKNNIGIYNNLNSGIKRADQEFISLIAGDDYWDKNKLLFEMESVLAEKADYGFSGVVRFTEKNKTYDKTQYPDLKNIKNDFTFFILNRSFHPTSALIKKAIYDDIGVFNTSKNIYEDWDFSIRYASKFNGVFSGAHSIYRRVHKESTSFKLEQSNSKTYYHFLITDILKRHKKLVRSLPITQRCSLKTRYNSLIFGSNSEKLTKFFLKTVFNYLNIFYL